MSRRPGGLDSRYARIGSAIADSASADKQNISMDYLVGWVDDRTPTRELRLHLSRALARLLDIEPAPETDLQIDDADFVGIKEIVASAGTGATVIDERIVGRVKFPRTWLRKHGLKG